MKRHCRLWLIGPLLASLVWQQATAAEGKNAHYVSNRAPLTPSAFVKLPVGSIRAEGWLAEQMRRQIEGATGHLDELFADVGPNSAWLGGDGEDWERGPYYVRGCTALAYATGDARMLAKIKPWIEWTLASQTEAGNFGPESNADWWPRMVMLQALQIHYEATGDARVIPFMTRYFAYQRRQLLKQPLESWAYKRGGDNTQSVVWLYNRTGEKGLLDLMRLLKEQTHDWTRQLLEDRPIDAHVVNLSQGYKQPAICYQFTHDARQREGSLRGIELAMKYHGRIDGLHAADEATAGKSGTRGTELCAVVEYMHSLETLIKILGEPSLADRLETVAFNAHPTMWMPDWRGHQYFCQPNQVLCTKGFHGFSTDHGDDLTFGLLAGYPCCATNGHMGWPMLANHLWMATPDNGLAAIVYSPCRVTAKAGAGETVTIVEETGYPFHETVRMTVQCEGTVRFPLVVRIPGWCAAARIEINGEAGPGAKAGTFVSIDRAWASGDVVSLTLPMAIRLSRWENNSVGVERGPLVFALWAGEDWRKFPDWRRGDAMDGWPMWEVHPKYPWNMALKLDAADPAASFKVEVGDVPPQPWDFHTAPVKLIVPARRVPSWKIDAFGNAGPPPISPVSEPDQRERPVTLLPYGAARIRVAYMPVLAD
jgi:hypothetical protein